MVRLHVAFDHGAFGGAAAAEVLPAEDLAVNARDLCWPSRVQLEGHGERVQKSSVSATRNSSFCSIYSCAHLAYVVCFLWGFLFPAEQPPALANNVA